MPGEPASPLVYRPRGSRLIAATIAVLSLIGVFATVAAADPQGWRSIAPLLLIAYLAWWLLWYPRVTLDNEGVRLTGPVATVDISWHSVIHVEAKYAATIVTPHGRYTAWAAPAPGILAAAAEARGADRSHPDARDRSVRVGELGGTASGDVVARIREIVARRAEAGVLDAVLTESLRPVRRVHVVLLSVLAVLVVASVAATVWT